MPKLVPYETEPHSMPKKPIYRRLGKRDSFCESIHTSQLQLYNPGGFKAKNRASVQDRLGPNWVSGAEKERNRIALHAYKTFAKSASRNMRTADTPNGALLFNAFTKAIEPYVEPVPKYDMKVQKEIFTLQVIRSIFTLNSTRCKRLLEYSLVFRNVGFFLQGKELYYACPGAYVISSDGPGLRGVTKVPNHKTDISLNQRFAWIKHMVIVSWHLLKLALSRDFPNSRNPVTIFAPLKPLVFFSICQIIIYTQRISWIVIMSDRLVYFKTFHFDEIIE